jgi:tRNA1Val (adenine37-N6)-methyltransferase
MGNDYFRFKKFTISQDKTAFKVGTDGVLLGACADLSGVSRILDIGTGTGLVALMTAQRSEADIVAIEPEAASYLQALENVRDSPWPGRIEVVNTKFRTYTSEVNGKFDLIITNPPFFRDSLKNPDPARSAARHTDSLSSEEILEGTIALLNDNGSLQLILPYAEGNLFIAEANLFGLYCNRIIKVKPNPSGDVIRLILKFERVKKQLSEKFLTIETGIRHRYTEEYKDITKDFYLGF